MSESKDPRRAIPSVGIIVEHAAQGADASAHSRELMTAIARELVEEARQHPERAPKSIDEWSARVRHFLAQRMRPSLRPVLNATGVVLHTNLGRAPLPRVALEAIAAVAAGYANLEYDLAAGERGSRHMHCVSLLRELTGAEDALVVNNGAAALVLALNTLADGRDALVSRGELVEIGGSFRVPDIMARSGARLVEVGTTNRTHVDDYRRALGAHAAAIVKVHRSNFAVQGFTAEAAVKELVPLARERGAALIHDLGSGLFVDLARWGLAGEPLAAEAVRDGADVVTMSGDKLLGGPQAGIILGRKDAIARMRANPLTRALRVDKLTLAALEATLALYRDPERARREIPTLAMLTATPAELEARAKRVAKAFGRGARVVASEGSVGGGAFPTAKLPGSAVALEGKANVLEEKLRAGTVPVIGRIESDALLLDLRSVPASDDDALVAAVQAALA
jgi:L-seryl-tRNA(Ser) seleniumtransferase